MAIIHAVDTHACNAVVIQSDRLLTADPGSADKRLLFDADGWTCIAAPGSLAVSNSALVTAGRMPFVERIPQPYPKRMMGSAVCMPREERRAVVFSIPSTAGEMPLMYPAKLQAARTFTQDDPTWTAQWRREGDGAPVCSTGEARVFNGSCVHCNSIGEMVHNDQLHVQWRGQVAVDAPGIAGNTTRREDLRVSACRMLETAPSVCP